MVSHAGGIQGPALVSFIIRGGPAATLFALAQQQGGAGLDDGDGPAGYAARLDASPGHHILRNSIIGQPGGTMAENPKVALGTRVSGCQLPTGRPPL